MDDRLDRRRLKEQIHELYRSVAVAFGRSGGKRLVEESSNRAKELRAAPPA